MYLFVGLGNPGTDYAKHRHNVGFQCIDFLTSTPLFSSEIKKEPKFKGEYAKTEEVILLKPQTFMNRSGDSVQRVMQFFKIKPADVYIIHDDLDIPVGQFKITLKGPPIHNGISSISGAIGNEYNKVRVGIENRLPTKENNGVRIPGEAYVLQDFTAEEAKQMTEVFKSIAERFAILVK
jgi:PTH1 family peptidyl-tRNA hydrolase